MVVTTRAGHRQALSAAHDDIDTIVDDVRGAVEEATSERQETQRGEVAVVLRILDDLVGGDLQAEELVVGQVVVEGLHDPVAIGIGIRIAAFFLEDVALRVGIAGDVEPVTAPAFAESRRAEETVDKFLGGLRITVGDEGGDLGGRRLVTGKRERQATDDDFATGLRIEAEPGFLELGQDEAIERLADLGDVGRSDDGRSRSDDRLEGPVLARVEAVGLGFGRPRQALTHPLRERGDRLRRKFIVFARHGVDIRGFDVVDRKDQSAGFRVSGYDDRAEFAALEDVLTRIQAKTGLLFLLSVALVAMVGEDRADFLFEKLQLGVARRGGRLCGSDRSGQEKRGD